MDKGKTICASEMVSRQSLMFLIKSRTVCGHSNVRTYDKEQKKIIDDIYSSSNEADCVWKCARRMGLVYTKME